ncbi:DUF962 domain-containing protein [Colwellia sp. MB02u-6]|uniref:DUF962 domain-containing protein n=1 Tax=Colwellia sp. MB02u-6 TaxID=2759824 RepID=UPI0015F5B96C|nr:DUF962 domain-containing protein [Colwellia sp. MB02u-6]MBA6327939.1 DUF962 domain-containing protein [Colwellia sp. MB02u-6]
MTNTAVKKYKNFKSFYPFYLSQHENIICRRLHFIGSSLIIITLTYVLINAAWPLFWILPFLGYGFAWLGHFFFEKNTPATFTYPWYSLLGDWVMYKDILMGKLKF